MSLFWSSWFEELWCNTQRALTPDLHHIQLQLLTVGSECVAGTRSKELYRTIFRSGWGSQILAGAWTSVFPNAQRACGLSLPCQNWSSFVEYGLSSYSGWVESRSQQNAGSKSVHFSVSPGDNPHFSCQTGFHSYFTSKLWTLLISQPCFIWNNDLS